MTEFHHGALCDTYEAQANKQGLTFGDKAEFVQRVGFGLVTAHIHGVITDSEMNKILHRFHKMVMLKCLKKLDVPDMNVGKMTESEKKMPSVTPQYTEAEIQKMQEMEQAEIEKAYELGKAEQQKVGHWKRVSADKYVQHATYYYRCSECDNDIIGEHNYCPHCGAKMESKEGGEQL